MAAAFVGPAETMRAHSLLRRSMWATVALGLFAGVAGGLAIATWNIARRTSTVYERFVVYEGVDGVGLFACPDGVGPETPDWQQLCGTYDYADMLEFLEGIQGVTSAGRATQALASVSTPSDADVWSRQLVPVALDLGALPSFGRPIVVSGRFANPNVVEEVVVNEELAARLNVGVGDELVVTPYRVDEFDIAGEGSIPPGGLPTTVTIVGVMRRPSDLVGRLGGTRIYDDASTVAMGPAWWAAIDGDAARYGVILLFDVDASITHLEVIDAIRAEWPDRMMEVEQGSASGEDATVVDAIHLQAVGLTLVAAVIGLAALVFVGQTVARQAKREWQDASTFAALGMTRGRMVVAAGMRALPIAAIATVAAAVITVGLSPLGPIGVGRAAEPYPGVSIDGLVLLVGLPAVALTVLIFATTPIAMLRSQTNQRNVSRSSPIAASLSAPGVAGWAMTRSRRAGDLALGSAVVGVALAAVAGVAAWTLTASYADLVEHPDRYGATWDIQVGNVGDEQQEADTRSRLEAVPGIRAVGIKSDTGLGTGTDFTLASFEPFLGDVNAAVINDGRAPISANEIALGRRSMDDFGVGIGDVVTIPLLDGAVSQPFDVVGEVVVNDALSAQSGVGALVIPTVFDELSPGSLSQTYVVWVDSEVDRAATLQAVRNAFPTSFVEPHPTRQILNLELVSDQPAVLAITIGLLAGAALIHALVMSIRRGRRQIGVLQSLGFTRHQVASSVAWHASILSVTALIVGVPTGVVVGRVTWRAIAANLGVSSPPVLPTPAIAVVGVLVIAVANLAALGPGLVAARTSPAVALRTE